MILHFADTIIVVSGATGLASNTQVIQSRQDEVEVLDTPDVHAASAEADAQDAEVVLRSK